jgi:iron(III) transport system ATP-binding protein
MFLQVSGINVSYDGSKKPVVQDISFGLSAGEIGVLIGPSGCGKTTLLRAIAGLETIQSGQIHIGDRLVSDANSTPAFKDRRVGMVFQDYALFPHLTIEENIAFGLHQWPKPSRKNRIAEALELVGLVDMRQKYPHQLSGGQQQRVALARALAPQPDLLLLDEPFSNLDVDLREHLAHEIRSILKKSRLTALFVTHDQLEAFAIGDVIGVMDSGVLHQWDHAYTLYHRPATRFVADFIGHGVFTPALIKTENGHMVVETPLGTLRDITEPQQGCSQLSGACEILLRADDIVHDDAAPVKAEIIRKLFRGSEFLYTLRLASGHCVMAHVPSHHDHSVGEWIGIRPEVDHVVTFNHTCPRTENGMCQLPCVN